MLELARINAVVIEAASSILKRHGARVHAVMSEPASDLDGKDALDIRIVLARGTFDNVVGDDALDTQVEIVNKLREAKEDRFPFLTWTSEEELEEVGDFEC